jgi:hypothetical protein
MLRIRSEHAIGFLKGRFQSLKSLRVNISNEKSHKFATYWVVACVALHTFAMRCEAEERGGSDSVDEDPFIREGLSSDEDEDQRAMPRQPREPGDADRLSAGKEWRETLKNALFDAKARQDAQRRRRHHV